MKKKGEKKKRMLGNHVCSTRRRRALQAASALLDALFAAIAAGLVGQRDLRTRRVEIVRSEVVRNTKRLRQPPDRRRMTQQMVIVDVRHPDRLQRADQRLVLIGQAKSEAERLASR